MTKVLVTGAYGFLGRYVVREMLEHGYEVTAFGRDPEKLKKLYADESTRLMPDGSPVPGILHTFQGDFCIPDQITEACKGMDYVIHCGAKMKGWGRKEDFIEANYGGTKNVLDACEINHVKRLVYTSSPSGVPTEDNLHITEADYNENNHVNFYVESKVMAEKLVRGQNKVPYAMIRPRGLVGVGDKSIFPLMIKAVKTFGIPVFKKGQVVVDLCCIENVALSLRLCMETEDAEGQVYNITNGEPSKLTDLASRFLSILGLKARYIPLPFWPIYGITAAMEFVWKLLHIWKKGPPITRHDLCAIATSKAFDISKARRELGYQPKVTLDEMMHAIAEDYLKHNGKEN